MLLIIIIFILRQTHGPYHKGIRITEHKNISSFDQEDGILLHVSCVLYYHLVLYIIPRLDDMSV